MNPDLCRFFTASAFFRKLDGFVLRVELFSKTAVLLRDQPGFRASIRYDVVNGAIACRNQSILDASWPW